jgi:hypothetical protein
MIFEAIAMAAGFPLDEHPPRLVTTTSASAHMAAPLTNEDTPDPSESARTRLMSRFNRQIVEIL